MAALMVPLDVHEVEGLPLRVFASPHYVAFRKADFPWHSLDDLMAVLGVPEGDVLSFRRAVKASSAWLALECEEPRTVATPTGITTVGPHFMAQGIFDFLRYRPRLVEAARRRRVASRYRCVMATSTSRMLSHLSGPDRLAFTLAASDVGGPALRAKQPGSN